jgi:hypothetical protein
MESNFIVSLAENMRCSRIEKLDKKIHDYTYILDKYVAEKIMIQNTIESLLKNNPGFWAWLQDTASNVAAIGAIVSGFLFGGIGEHVGMHLGKEISEHKSNVYESYKQKLDNLKSQLHTIESQINGVTMMVVEIRGRRNLLTAQSSFQIISHMIYIYSIRTILTYGLIASAWYVYSRNT